MHQKCTRKQYSSWTRREETAMAVVTITMKFETSDKVVELLNQLNDRNIDVDVDVDVER